MSDVMPIEQAEFIDTLQRWFNKSTNMCHEDCYNLAFIIWQHKNYLSKMLGYEKGREDAMNDDGVPKQLLEMGYKKGRADAIDEVMKECERFRNQFKSFYYSDFVRIAEQLKEQNNEKTFR